MLITAHEIPGMKMRKCPKTEADRGKDWATDIDIGNRQFHFIFHFNCMNVTVAGECTEKSFLLHTGWYTVEALTLVGFGSLHMHEASTPDVVTEIVRKNYLPFELMTAGLNNLRR